MEADHSKKEVHHRRGKISSSTGISYLQSDIAFHLTVSERRNVDKKGKGTQSWCNQVHKALKTA
jgi:hypothetical protein